MSESPWQRGDGSQTSGAGLIPSTTFPDYTLAWLVAELQEQVKLLTWLLAEQTWKFHYHHHNDGRPWVILNALKMTLLVYGYAVGLAYLWAPR